MFKRLSAKSDYFKGSQSKDLRTPFSQGSVSGTPKVEQKPPQPPVESNAYRENKAKFQLSQFKFILTLGTGTFGRVLLCQVNDTYYAMKMLQKVDIVRLKQVEHIISEKAILARINHPFIVNLYCSFQDTRNLYMLLEYVNGGELFSHLRRAGKFNNDTARFYAAEIVLAIEYLHTYDIIYRDLKPENLLLDSEGHVKITDFGFAKVVPDRTFTLCGTPEYLAPEIIESKGHGKAVDYWALGILIYEMLNGFPPFFDETPMGIYEKILIGKVTYANHMDKDAKDLIKKLLANDRTKRIGNLKKGADDVKQHKWFVPGVDWELTFNRQVTAPFKPQVSHAGDSQNFDRYPEIDVKDAMGKPTDEDTYKQLFVNF